MLESRTDVTDGSRLRLQDESVELLDRELEKQIDPAADEREGIGEGDALGRISALNLGGVGHAPMGQNGLGPEKLDTPPWPDRRP